VSGGTINTETDFKRKIETVTQIQEKGRMLNGRRRLQIEMIIQELKMNQRLLYGKLKALGLHHSDKTKSKVKLMRERRKKRIFNEKSVQVMKIKAAVN